jgi:DNA-binding transcriptional LysR family regulator
MWTSVELREIRIFLLLAQELHFGRTAARAGVTQSRVSQSIRSLERKLGVQLAHRTSRRVALTPRGEAFRAEAADALASLERVLASTEEAGSGITDPVRLGVVSAAAVGPGLQASIDAYEERFPRSRVEIVGLPFHDRFGPLRAGAVDLMVSTLPLRQPDLVTGRVLGRDQRMLAVGTSHPLAASADVSVEDLADHAVADLDLVAPPELMQAMTPTTTPRGRPIPRVRLDAREASDLILAVARGRVVQPVTRTFADTYAHPRVRYVPIRDLPPSRSVLVWRRGDRTPSLRAFLRADAERRRAATA